MGQTLKTGDYVIVNKIKSATSFDYFKLLLYKSPLQQDASHPPLFIGRCIGVPGDVIQMGVNGFRVNGRILPHNYPSFRIHRDIKEPLLQTLDSLQIPLRRMTEDSISIILRLSLREKALLTENLSKIMTIEQIDDFVMTNEFSIPNDYYWILSENEAEGIDSRHLGLIPKSHIIGSIRYCLYSKDPTNRFKKII